MRRLPPGGLDVSALPSLTDHPELYPGLPAFLGGDVPGSWPADYLYAGGRAWRLQGSGEGGFADVLVETAGAKAAPLDTVLRDAGAPPLAERLPVVAIGSNAYPRQVKDKFDGEAGAEDTVPTFGGRLENARTVFCPRLSRRGYVPVTSRFAPGWAARAWVQWLSPGQLALVRRTEGPAYRLLRCGPRDGSLVFRAETSGAVVPVFWTFWYPSALAGPGGGDVACRGTVVARPPGSAGEERRESEVLASARQGAGPGVGAIASAGEMAAWLQGRALVNPDPPGAVESGVPGSA